MQYVGTDWAYRRASWCALSESGAIAGEGVVPADEDGLEFFWDHAEALEAVGRSPQDASTDFS
jgi:hypothetical protein